MALLSTAFETLMAGGRAGGKTWTGQAWLLQDEMKELLIDKPYYRGLVVRRQSTDLREWIDKSKEMYLALGAKYVGRPAEIYFPSGAIIYTTHLSDDYAWSKIQGWEVQRVLIEEAGQVEDEDRYVKLIGSLRSTFEDIRPRVFLTANPGGPGHGWLKRRFIDAKDHQGRSAQPYKEFDPIGNGTRNRLYVPTLIDDNPHILKADPGYLDYLESLPPALRRAWRHGDWSALEGCFFEEFRAHHIEGEPPEACHVVPAHELDHYLRRWIGGDWGYSHESAFYWMCRAEDTRIHTYREFVASKLGPDELGVRVAELTLPDLEKNPSGVINLALSPDAFARRDDRNTVAQQIADGMSLVLGPEAVFLVDPTEDERALGQDAWAAVERRREAQKSKLRIAIRRANNDRAGGWQYIRQLLRWWPLRDRQDRPIDFAIIRDILRRPDGPVQYLKYLQSLSAHEEVLPRLLIHDCCPRLVECLPSMEYDDHNKEDIKKRDGDDPADALRYGAMEHRKDDMLLPKGVAVDRAMRKEVEKYGYVSPHSQSMMARVREAEYDKKHKAAQWIVPQRGVRRR